MLAHFSVGDLSVCDYPLSVSARRELGLLSGWVGVRRWEWRGAAHTHPPPYTHTKPGLGGGLSIALSD